MQTAIINIKAEPKLKRQAQRVAANLGLPLGTVLNNYLRQFVVDQRVEFRHPLMPNKATARSLRAIDRDIAKGRNMSKVYTTIAEMDTHLDSL
ncbi:MAG TPA: hypothetical protein VJJ22_03980 [Candidatus Paceibacterota bacterium]